MEFDDKVFEESRSLNSYALQLTRNPDEAKDLVQETMLKAFKYKAKFTEGTNLKGWLFTIMRNSFINNYRRVMRRNTFIDTTDNTYYLDAGDYVELNRGEARFMKNDIMEAVNTLPDDLRITFSMNMEGFKYHEIADELDIPIGTVKTRIFVAKRKLRKKLKTYAEHYGLKEN